MRRSPGHDLNIPTALVGAAPSQAEQHLDHYRGKQRLALRQAIHPRIACLMALTTFKFRMIVNSPDRDQYGQ
jgi:hypothetical protein